MAYNFTAIEKKWQAYWLENKTFASTSRNVIGEIVGSEHPDEVVLMGGHFDGHDIAQGAGDDGAGTITGLEAARVLVPHKGKLKRTVRVICFGSEGRTMALPRFSMGTSMFSKGLRSFSFFAMRFLYFLGGGWSRLCPPSRVASEVRRYP